MNQCDGCRAGIPVNEKGLHRMGGSTYPNYMICQKHKYEGISQQRERCNGCSEFYGTDYACRPECEPPASPKQRERCDCNTDCLKATGHLNEEIHECQKHGEWPIRNINQPKEKT